MSTRRLRDLDKRTVQIAQPCLHREHQPPSHMVYRPGVYEHTCPGCGRSFQFTVFGGV